jgi:hypothetical protein
VGSEASLRASAAASSLALSLSLVAPPLPAAPALGGKGGWPAGAAGTVGPTLASRRSLGGKVTRVFSSFLCNICVATPTAVSRSSRGVFSPIVTMTANDDIGTRQMGCAARRRNLPRKGAYVYKPVLFSANAEVRAKV